MGRETSPYVIGKLSLALIYRIRNLAAKVLREEPAMEQREMNSAAMSGAGAKSGVFLSSKTGLELQRSSSTGAHTPLSLEAAHLRHLDDLVAEDEVRPNALSPFPLPPLPPLVSKSDK